MDFRLPIVLLLLGFLCLLPQQSYGAPPQPPDQVALTGFGGKFYFNCASGASLLEDAGQYQLALTEIRSPSPTPQLSFTVQVEQGADLLQGITVQYSSPQPQGTIVFAPAPNRSGEALLRIELRDSTSADLSIARQVKVRITSLYDRPQLVVHAPTAGQVIDAPGSILAQIEVLVDEDFGATITPPVEMIEGSSVVAQASAPTAAGRLFQFAYEGAPIGSHTLQFRARDSRGSVVTSAPVTVEVRQPPSVGTPVLTLPYGTTVALPNFVVIWVTADTVNGVLPSIELLVNDVAVSPPAVFQTVTANKYGYTWYGAVPGTQTLRARVRYNGGAPILSAPVVLTAQAPLPIPSKPANFRGQAISSTAVVLSWTGTENPQDTVLWYKISRSTTAISGPYTQFTQLSGTSAQVGNLLPNTTYYFMITAGNRSGDSPGAYLTVQTLP